MGFVDAAHAKAQAQVSDAQADVAELEAQLDKAKSQLKMASKAGGALDAVSETPVVGSLTSGMRGHAGVEQAKAKAEADRIQADLASARTRLDMALKAQRALRAVTGDDKPVDEVGGDEVV